MSKPKLLARIQKLSSLTPGERQIAEYLVMNYPKTAFESAGAIAVKLGTSKVSIVSFVSKLGYDGYNELQGELRDDISKRLDSPFERFPATRRITGDDSAGLLAKNLELQLRSLEETYRWISHDQFEKAIEFIISLKGTLYIAGDRASFGLAHIFHTDLRVAFERTVLLEGSTSLIADKLIDITSDDAALCISSERYSQTTTRIARYFAREGASIILLTDSPMAPLIPVAKYSFIFSPTSFYNTAVPALALLEAFIVAVFLRREKQLNRRLARAERVWRELSVFEQDASQNTGRRYKRRPLEPNGRN